MLIDPIWPDWGPEPPFDTILGDAMADKPGGWSQTPPRWYWRIGRLFRPAHLLEIGTFHGGSLIAMLVGMEPWQMIEVVSVDIEEETQADAARRIRDRFGDRGRFLWITGDSTTEPTIERIRSHVAERGPFDLAHIDGCHAYEGVWRDLHTAWESVRPGGIIVGHDTHHNRGDIVSCGRAWNDFILAHQAEIDWRRDIVDADSVGTPGEWPPGITVIQKRLEPSVSDESSA